MAGKQNDGTPGNDTLFGGAGDDTLYGGAGDDRLDGAGGADKVYGGKGDDQFSGDSHDTLFGGAGSDTFTPGRGGVVYGGGDGGPDDLDTLDLRGMGNVYTKEVVPDEDGNGSSGYIQFLDEHDQPTGERLDFFNIERFLKDDQSGNRAPDAVDDTASTARDMAVSIDVLDNDSDPDGDPLRVSEASVDRGTVHIEDDGTLRYTPEDGFTGDVTITYSITDDRGGVDTATVAMRVHCPTGPDGIVEGTAGADVIDVAYTGDPDGDRVDNRDAILGDDAPNDDRIEAYGGDDTVRAGLGDDMVSGGRGNDTIHGEAGDDTLMGDGGRDTIFGGDGDDVITGGQGVDRLFGDDDRDLFRGGNGGDEVTGGEGGDDYDTLDLSGEDVDRIEYTSDDREDGIVYFRDGTTLRFEEIENVVPCFTPGTVIATPRGERLVEELREGDRIITRDNGIQEIRWVGHKQVGPAQFPTSPHLKPVMIRAGALGNGLPERDMMVSPNHRLLLTGDRAQLYFEDSEVLAAAKHMVGSKGIHTVEVMRTSYIHFMFDRHEVVLSNGAWTESFQPGDHTLKGIGAEQRDEIYELFPELRHRAGIDDYRSARKALKRHEARLMVV